MNLLMFVFPVHTARPFFLFLTSIILFFSDTAVSAEPPGGFVEQALTAQVRPKLSASQIQSFIPTRGEFTFPAPYNTGGIRLTNASDCNGGDCVWPVGYSYWRNINNHVGSDTMYIFLGLDRNRGGSGPTLFSYHKASGNVVNLGELFSATSGLGSISAEGWYFSATLPTKLYVNDGPRMLRYDVLSKQFQTVFDINEQLGAGNTIWQMHSSDDDRVHSVTVRNASSYEMLGCGVYNEATANFQYFPKLGNFDECHVDKSGRWLVILEDIDARFGLEMRIIDLTTGAERVVWDQDGAVGHADMGHGYVVGTDNWNNLPNAILSWDFFQNTLSGLPVFHNLDWSNSPSNHVSHTNAQPGVAADQQYACGSNAARGDSAWANEVVCFRLDGSLDTLVVAPVMTDMNSPVGGDDYSKAPKGNLDVTGEYFIWTSNTGGSRMDAYITKVPSQLLFAGGGGSGGGSGSGGGGLDVSYPEVSISGPMEGTTLGSSVIVSANAVDNIGVVGVQFQLDGVNLGNEITAAPYSISWNTSSTFAGAHTLTAVARDAAGNATTSNPVVVSVLGDILAPAISMVTASSISSTAATVSWGTDETGDSQVEYGLTSSYGTASALDTTMLTAHSVKLNGLTANSLYHYRVRSRDALGNLALSANATFTTAAAIADPVSSPQNVAWIDAVNTTVTGNSLQKTGGCDGCTDASAVSRQQILSGDAYLEFTIDETNLVRYIGLNNNNSTNNAMALPFAFKIVSNYVEVRESGLYRADSPLVAGDVLRIAVKSGVIEYAKNGTVFYTSSAIPVYPLRAYTVLSSMNVAINNAVISNVSTSANPPIPANPDPVGPQNVTWTDVVNITVADNSLQKSDGCDGCADASAVSQQQIYSGEGNLAFTVPETSLVRYIGLSNNASDTNVSSIPFGFKIVSNYAEVRESGLYRADVAIVSGDVLQIRVRSDLIEYAKNGTVFYTSNAVPVYPLRAKAIISSMSASINNVIISTNSFNALNTQIPAQSSVFPADEDDASVSIAGGGSVSPLVLVLLWLVALATRRDRRKKQV